MNFLTYTKAHTKSLQGTNVRFYATRVGEWRLAHTTTTITAKKTSKPIPKFTEITMRLWVSRRVGGYDCVKFIMMDFVEFRYSRKFMLIDDFMFD